MAILGITGHGNNPFCGTRGSLEHLAVAKNLLSQDGVMMRSGLLRLIGHRFIKHVLENGLVLAKLALWKAEPQFREVPFIEKGTS